MANLVVHPPVLKFETVTPGVAVLEKKFEVLDAAVAFPDGTPFLQENLGTAGFFTYRRKNAGSAVEILDEEAKEWKLETAVAVESLKPKPFLFKEGEPEPWQGLMVAAGQKDKNEVDQFSKQTANFPEYFFKAYFSAEQAGVPVSGLSGPSPTVRFVGFTDASRAGIKLNEDGRPEDATEIHLFLRNAALQLIGSVEIRNVGGLAQLDVAKWDAAASPVSRIRLNTDGSIEVVSKASNPSQSATIRLELTGDIVVTPAPGRVTRIGDALEVSGSGGNMALSCSGELTLAASKVNLLTSLSLGAGRTELHTGSVFYRPTDAAGNPIGVDQFLDIT